MNFSLMHPRDQIVMLMKRIYGYGMTTTSGGNLSILDESGDLWITPAAVDKGTLQAADIVCVKADGRVDGIHKPSSEYPFHKAILEKRPDLRAVLHAHPPALVSFSIVDRLPDTHVIPKAHDVCGEVGYAAYAMPGSRELGEKIAASFAAGHNVTVLENHGIVSGGATLFQAFERFETLDFCARLIINASILGKPRPISTEQFDLFRKTRNDLPSFTPETHTSRERELRKSLCAFLHRAYDQQLVTSMEGTFSVRVDKDVFLITPYGVDRKYMEVEDLVLIDHNRAEIGKIPSRSVRLHSELYQRHPEIHSIIIAHPTHVMAFGISKSRFDTRTIPECYIVLRDIPVLPYGAQFMEGGDIVSTLNRRHPLVLVENDCLVVSGTSLLQAYDRLEVAEFSARAVIHARSLAPLSPISAREIEALETAFPH